MQSSIWIYFIRFTLILTMIILFVSFVIWRIDSPRVERLRLAIIDQMPNFEASYDPFTGIKSLFYGFQSYEQLARENRQLRRDLKLMKDWREAAIQLRQTNAELRALNNLKFAPEQKFITGDIIADPRGGFTQTALINVGRNQGVAEGTPALDGFGLVGRIIAVGEENSRILFANDAQSQLSVTIMPERIRAIAKGNNTRELELNLIDTGKRLVAGSRVVTSGNGILPPDLPVGSIEIGEDGVPKINLAANFNALEFVTVLIPDAPPEFEDDILVVLPNSQNGNVISGQNETR